VRELGPPSGREAKEDYAKVIPSSLTTREKKNKELSINTDSNWRRTIFQKEKMAKGKGRRGLL